MTPHVGDRIRAARTLLGMTVAELSSKTGISKRRIYDLENGARDVHPGYRQRLSAAMKIPADIL